MTDKKQAPFAFDGLDRVLHEKARLGILTSLAGHPEGLGFSELKQLCGLSDGNLSRHLQVLEEANLLELNKAFEGKRPHTSCKLTDSGRKRFSDYLSVLENVLLSAKKLEKSKSKGQLKEKFT